MHTRHTAVPKLARGIAYDLKTCITSRWSWCGGSSLALFLVVQLVTGFILTRHYDNSLEGAFERVQRVIHDIPAGWLIQSLHANGASFFFIVLYAHLGRGLYYGCYKKYPVWLSGLVILIVAMGTAFTGYVLVWGQIRYWGLTVITNIVGALPYVGTTLVDWILGGPTPGGPTLSRFFSIHFVLPIFIAVLSVFHIAALHHNGSRSIFGNKGPALGLPFFPFFTRKDIFGFVIIIRVFGVVVLWAPGLFADAANYVKANIYYAPAHIQPEWYFLWAYAILRCFPSKGGGIFLIAVAIGALFVLPACCGVGSIGITSQAFYWAWVTNLVGLSYLGRCPAVYPYVVYRALRVVLHTLFLTGFIYFSRELPQGSAGSK